MGRGIIACGVQMERVAETKPNPGENPAGHTKAHEHASLKPADDPHNAGHVVRPGNFRQRQNPKNTPANLIRKRQMRRTNGISIIRVTAALCVRLCGSRTF